MSRGICVNFQTRSAVDRPDRDRIAADDKLRELLAEQKIDTADVIRGCRFSDDRENAHHRAQSAGGSGGSRAGSRPFPSPDRARSSRTFGSRLPEIDAIIFEDYGKGFLSAELVSADLR